MEQQINYSRRNAHRRSKERRENPYAFNSPEWIAMMEERYVLWPKVDNRKQDRRSSDRRTNERRTTLRNVALSRSMRRARTHDMNNILGHQEKQFILDLFNEEIK